MIKLFTHRTVGDAAQHFGQRDCINARSVAGNMLGDRLLGPRTKGRGWVPGVDQDVGIQVNHKSRVAERISSHDAVGRQVLAAMACKTCSRVGLVAPESGLSSVTSQRPAPAASTDTRVCGGSSSGNVSRRRSSTVAIMPWVLPASGGRSSHASRPGRLRVHQLPEGFGEGRGLNRLSRELSPAALPLTAASSVASAPGGPPRCRRRGTS